MRAMLLATVAAMPLSHMSEFAETILLGSGESAVRVNKSDYDADTEKMEKLYGKPAATKAQDENTATAVDSVGTAATQNVDGPLPPAPSAPNFGNPVPPSTPNHDTYMVVKNGKGTGAKFLVVRADGSPVTGFRDVEEDGYKTEAEAWTAIETVKKQPFEQIVTPPANMPPAPPAPPETTQS